MCLAEGYQGHGLSLEPKAPPGTITGSPWHCPTASQPAPANPGLLPSPRRLGPPHPLAEGKLPIYTFLAGPGAGKG